MERCLDKKGEVTKMTKRKITKNKHKKELLEEFPYGRNPNCRFNRLFATGHDLQLLKHRPKRDMNTLKEVNELLDKMRSESNFLSLDEPYLKKYRHTNRATYIGKSVITDSTDSSNMTQLIKTVIDDTGVKTVSTLTHALLYLEVPKDTPLEKIIKFNIAVEDFLPCPFDYAISNSENNDTKLYIIALLI